MKKMTLKEAQNLLSSWTKLHPDEEAMVLITHVDKLLEAARVVERGNNKKKITAWADVGSNGGIFEFQSGPVATRYPHLMHVYSQPGKGLRKIEMILSDNQKQNEGN